MFLDFKRRGYYHLKKKKRLAHWMLSAVWYKAIKHRVTEAVVFLVDYMKEHHFDLKTAVIVLFTLILKSTSRKS